jgi:hypothetical protein
LTQEKKGRNEGKQKKWDEGKKKGGANVKLNIHF